MRKFRNQSWAASSQREAIGGVSKEAQDSVKKNGGEKKKDRNVARIKLSSASRQRKLKIPLIERQRWGLEDRNKGSK